MENVIILGTGPAGLTAAIYTARAGLDPLVVEGHEPGGQLTTTTMVENFPGFSDGVLGPELMETMRRQAERFGARFQYGRAVQTNFGGDTKEIHLEDETVLQARVVIISTGASAKLLGLAREKELMGRGLSTCATCDGFFFRDKQIAVVGGGDSAMEEAMFLSRYAAGVRVIHRREALRASKIMQERAMANPKIEFVWNSVPVELLGAEALSGVRLQHVQTGETSDLALDGLFYSIGHHPNTEFLDGQVKLDAAGYIVTHRNTRTSVPGVFACGDVQDSIYRQAVTAAGSGCMAAMDAEKYLEGSMFHDWSV